jgi:beta-lactam-binding protein with PASTA domain
VRTSPTDVDEHARSLALGGMTRNPLHVATAAAATILIVAVAAVTLFRPPEVSAPTVPLPSASSSDATASEIPDVSDLTQEAATRLLEDAGFSVQLQFEQDPTTAAGIAIRTDPPSGTIAPDGADVILFVSGTD